ncbi:MAG TPA: response regulator [Gemmatimonadales bacterium]|jgi:two-component system chemotaxis response regulator CheY|nr:response regulator [Gemmatimonadales bacterium]
MRILIVEDAALVRKMYALAFPSHQHELVPAENGRAALDLLRQTTGGFDLILLDLRMPDMDGVAFISELRQRAPRFRHVPIIVTTAEPEDSPLLAEARALGIQAVVRKPWKPQELRETAARVTGVDAV